MALCKSWCCESKDESDIVIDKRKLRLYSFNTPGVLDAIRLIFRAGCVPFEEIHVIIHNYIYMYICCRYLLWNGSKKNITFSFVNFLH